MKALKDASVRADFVQAIQVLLRRHIPIEKTGSCAKGDDCSKGFFQHANAVVMGHRANDGHRDELRHEKHVVRLLSVIFVGTWVLLLTTLVGLVCSVGLTVLNKKKKRHHALIRTVLLLLLLWILEGLTLRLWTEQSIRYNRRLIHAYISIASHGDPAMDMEPSSID